MSKAENQLEMYLAFEECLVGQRRSLCTSEMAEIAKQHGVDIQPDSLGKNVISGRLAFIIGTPVKSVRYRNRRLYYVADRSLEEIDFRQSQIIVDQTYSRR